MNEKIKHPKEVICMILYKREYNVEYICKKLYGKKRNSRISKWIKELLKEGWIKDVSTITQDRRFHHYQSTPKCFFDDIVKNLNNKHVELTENEKKGLLKFINSTPFKDFILTIVPDETTSRTELPDFIMVKEILGYYSIYISSLENYICTKFGISTDVLESDGINSTEPLPIIQEFPSDKGLSPYETKKYMRVNMDKMLGKKDMFLPKFMNLSRPLREKLSHLQPPFQRKMLAGFFGSVASFVDTANEKT